MHIFIDESGIFKRDLSKPQSIACVGAAIVPGHALAGVERGYRRLAEGWPRSDKGEVKGRLLGERHVADLCALLAPAGVLFAASVMDMNLIEDAAIDRHRAGQAARFTEGLADAQGGQAAADARRRRRTLERMHRQLYAQAVALTDVAWKALRIGRLCCGAADPGACAHVRWVIDAKEKRRRTRYERWWRNSVAPLLHARSLHEPAAGPAGGGDPALRHDGPGGPMPVGPTPDGEGPDARADNLAAVSGADMVFATAEAHVGLQIADILTNALRRALMGHLRPAGWRPLGSLTVGRPEGAIALLQLAPRQGRARRPYAQVIEELNRSGRSASGALIIE